MGQGLTRLTHKRESGMKSGYWSPNRKEELVERLAAYEDTGLTPEEIREKFKEQDRQYLAKCREADRLREKLDRLEEQGKLPCAIGDTVWYWDKEFDPIEEAPFEGEVLGYDINITRYGTSYIEIRGISKEPEIVYYHDKIEIEDFGKTVFLTKEEAEDALKEMSE